MMTTLITVFLVLAGLFILSLLLAAAKNSGYETGLQHGMELGYQRGADEFLEAYRQESEKLVAKINGLGKEQ